MTGPIARRGFLGLGALAGLGAVGFALDEGGSHASAPAACNPKGPDPRPLSWERSLERYRYGVSLAGLEFGEDSFPGQYNAEVQQPPEDRYPYYAGKGLRSIRLPYLWERFQPELFGDLDGELNLLSIDRHRGRVLFKDVVRHHLDLAHRHKMKVLLDPHNYGARALRRKDGWSLTGGKGRRGRFAIGSKEVPVAAFADFTAKLAVEFGDHPGLMGFDIMNEPVMMPDDGEGWAVAAQAAIDAVRRVNGKVLLFVEGYNYANPFGWESLNPTLHTLRDPSDRLVFSAHLYFDDNHSGRYLGSEAIRPGPRSTPKRAIDDIRPFFDWLDRHRLRGHIGEFGIPDAPAWKPVAIAFIDYCAQRDILLHAWADWPNDRGYVLQTNPVGRRDKTIVTLLSNEARRPCTRR